MKRVNFRDWHFAQKLPALSPMVDSWRQWYLLSSAAFWCQVDLVLQRLVLCLSICLAGSNAGPLAMVSTLQAEVVSWCLSKNLKKQHIHVSPICLLSLSLFHWIQVFTEISERSLADCGDNGLETYMTTHQKECSPT